MYRLSIFIGKITLYGLRLLRRHGSALPGLIVEKTNKNFLNSSLGGLPQGVIIVTGTNGKTTTTKIISELLQADGLRVLTNKSGSNFMRGIISTVVEGATWSGRLNYDIAVFEQDEAHAVRLVERVKPNGVVALNIMRDQLDRFGEIDTTAKLVGKVVNSASDWAVLNANDPRISKLADDIKSAKTLWFGHSKKLLKDFVTDDQHHHLEGLNFFEAARPDLELTNINAGEIKLKQGDKKVSMNLQLDGNHNAINATAALLTFLAVRPNSLITAKNALSKITPAFGRGEAITLKNGAKVRIQLVKNPSGFTHSLRLLDTGKPDVIGIVINDDYPDGRDVSWLWDVEFDQLKNDDLAIVCGGMRGLDMAVRLKYDEIHIDQVELDLDKFTEVIGSELESDEEAIIFCTYTAMLGLRKQLARYSNEVKGSIL